MSTKQFYSLFIIGIILLGVCLVFVPQTKANDPPQPYNYWYAPQNSFGIKEYKTVNWNFFKQLFNSHTDWILEYKRYSYSDWTNGNQYLTVGKTWNETGFWKINLTFSCPVDVYEARMTFGCDLVVLDYVEREDFEIWLNYTIPNTNETYSVFFNWSDLASVPDLYFSHGKTDDLFWFRFGRINIPSGVYVFDPIFGYSNDSSDYNFIYTAGNTIGSYATCPNNCIVDNMTVQLKSQSGCDAGDYMNLIMLIYEFVDYDTDFAGNLIGKTFESGNLEPFSMNFPYNLTLDIDGTVELTSGTDYYLILGVVSETIDSGESVKISANADPAVSIKKSGNIDSPLPNPLTGESALGICCYIYCSYSEGGTEWSNTCPSINNLSIANNSYEINITVGNWSCNITDIDGNNTSGSINCSNGDNMTWSNLSNGTRMLNLSLLEYATNYTIWVNLSDEYCNVSNVYYFRTKNESGCPCYDEFIILYNKLDDIEDKIDNINISNDPSSLWSDFSLSPSTFFFIYLFIILYFIFNTRTNELFIESKIHLIFIFFTFVLLIGIEAGEIASDYGVTIADFGFTSIERLLLLPFVFVFFVLLWLFEKPQKE